MTDYRYGMQSGNMADNVDEDPGPQPGDEPAEDTPKVSPVLVTVAAGDTLESLEKDHGLDAGALYVRNSKRIEDEATARGFASSEQGRLLFPGTILDVAD